MPVTPMLQCDALAERVAQMGTEIRAAFGPEPIVVIGVLKGSIIFLADLVRAIPGDVELEFLGVSSYAGTETTGAVRITHDLRCDVTDRNVLLVEDIVDTGLTLDWIRRTLSARSPRALRVATLLDKPSRRRVAVEVDFCGFRIPDAFVVGYGLDYDERYRNLPYVGVLQLP
jgi:hypoxanthine phosphoribosyltransferase